MPPSAVTPERFARGMTFDEYVRYAGSPENLAREAWGGYFHLDVRPTGSMAEEVERLKGLGATVRGFIEEGGSFWTQMRDPEGNEFCVLRGPEDGWSPDEL
jgi:Glyoxalase-like domain